MPKNISTKGRPPMRSVPVTKRDTPEVKPQPKAMPVSPPPFVAPIGPHKINPNG